MEHYSKNENKIKENIPSQDRLRAFTQFQSSIAGTCNVAVLLLLHFGPPLQDQFDLPALVTHFIDLGQEGTAEKLITGLRQEGLQIAFVRECIAAEKLKPAVLAGPFFPPFFGIMYILSKYCVSNYVLDIIEKCSPVPRFDSSHRTHMD